MRIGGKSKLDVCAEMTSKLRSRGKTIDEIHRALKVKVDYTTLRDWLARHEVHPLENQSTTREAQRAKRQSVSLGLLDALSDSDQLARAAKILRILWSDERDWDERKIKNAIGAEGIGIPLNRDGEPDFTHYARKLGRKRVKSLGDLDFVIFALWTRKIRQQMPGLLHGLKDGGFVTRYLRPLFEVALSIRDEMLAAVDPKFRK